jgi:chemotaxis signal transduction protein
MQVLSLDTHAGLLLVPVSIVAQITSRDRQSAFEHELPFVRSAVQWREYNVPLVFSSEMLGVVQGMDDSYRRSVVLWPMKGGAKTDLFALTSLDSPRVIEIEDDAVAAPVEVGEVFKENSDLGYTLGFIQVGDRLGIIPDLKQLSEKLFSQDRN